MFGECHAHIFMNGRNYKEALQQHKEQVQEALIRQAFLAYQEKEIFFVRDGGDALHVSEQAKKIAKEYGIDYRTPIFAIHKEGHYGKIVGRSYRDLQEYQKLIKEVKRRGGDFVKLMLSGIMIYEQYGKLTQESLRADEIRELIHIAHEEGMSVMAHTNGADAVRNAALAGADSIEHGNYIDRDAAEAMKESKTVWVPTIATTGNLLGCDRYPQKELEKIFQSAKEMIAYAGEIGVLFALGSDAGAYRVLHGQGVLDEYHIFCDIFGETERLKTNLLEGETKIREKFQEGKR